MSDDRARRDPAGRPAAAGAAQRRDPVVRDAGDADRAHHLRRRRAGHRLHLHHRHRRLVGGRAAARPSRAAADRPRSDVIEAIWKDLFFAHPRHQRSARSPAWRWPRSTPRCGTALPPRRPAAVEGGGRRAARSAGLHHRRRLAAPSPRSSSSTKRVAAQGAGLPGREDQGRQAARRRGRRAPARGARRGRRRLRDHGRCQPGFTRGRGAAARAAYRDLGLALVRGAAAGRRPGRPRRARARKATMPIAVGESLYYAVALPRLPRARAPARSCRSTWRASAASRRGSRWRTWPRRSTSPSARIS